MPYAHSLLSILCALLLSAGCGPKEGLGASGNEGKWRKMDYEPYTSQLDKTPDDDPVVPLSDGRPCISTSLNEAGCE